MNCRPTSRSEPGARRQRQAKRSSRTERGFTLAEVLAALLFLSIVIPVAIQGLQVASKAGETAVRRAKAARIAESVMNELLVTGDYLRSTGSGSIQEGQQTYDWDMRLDSWVQGNLRLMVVRVKYPIQGQDHEVRLSTLVDTQIR